MANTVCQIKIVSVNSTNVQEDNTSKLVSANLNCKDNLSKIRDKLEKNSEIKMNDTFSFAKIINNNSSTSGSLLAVIAREDEETITLENIINKESNILYLKSEPDWRFFKDKLKLEYGRSVTLEKANNRAFKIVDCEMNKIDDGYENSKIQIDSEENKHIKNDRLLIADIDIPNFAKLGVSIRNSNIKNSNVASNLTYNIIEQKKRSLKFKLEPTTEFIEAVKDVIDSKDPRKFKDIINDFGQFIPNEVILGGRTYFIARENSEENFGKYVKNTGYQASNIKTKKKSSKSLSKNNSSKYQSFRLYGGKEVCSNNFNETDWVESLKDFNNWSCIKFKDPVNIFQLLSKDLRKQILLLVGKKILYTNTEDYNYHLSEPEKYYHTFKLNIPENLLEILQNKDAECSIFATVIDKKEKDIFNCQIVWPSNEDPKLIIHCFQNKFRRRQCKLKIMWMIVGYDINFDYNHSDFNIKLEVLKNNFNGSNCQAIAESLDLEYNPSILCFGTSILSELDSSNNSQAIGHYFFNDRGNKKIGSYLFSYCLENNHFVNLPNNFEFHTLIILNYLDSDNYGILPFQHMSKIRKMFNFIKLNSLKSTTPKFISLYSTENNFVPIFLKQKTREIKIKYININYCNQDNCICNICENKKKFKKLENNLKYAFFDPKRI
uniref:MACPF domain-containing protein n=1 Tax=Rhizophagus irregularis (strain DAOM 181602 / DAOM 197198 / MUCL 43194) TaxID=747089 RepID=U9T872_RHIID